MEQSLCLTELGEVRKRQSWFKYYGLSPLLPNFHISSRIYIFFNLLFALGTIFRDLKCFVWLFNTIFTIFSGEQGSMATHTVLWKSPDFHQYHLIFSCLAVWCYLPLLHLSGWNSCCVLSVLRKATKEFSQLALSFSFSSLIGSKRSNFGGHLAYFSLLGRSDMFFIFYILSYNLFLFFNIKWQLSIIYLHFRWLNYNTYSLGGRM